MRKPKQRIKSESLQKRIRRKLSIRKKVNGTNERPRICINKTNTNLFVQVIDDKSGNTLFAVKTFGKNPVVQGNNKEAATVLGKEIGKELLKRNIASAVFDRNGYKFTGVISTLAQMIRESGVQI